MNHIYYKVYELIEKIPAGKVVTYGQIGKFCGINPRFVGRILHSNPDPKKFPCHRVVNARGEAAENYAFGGKKAQFEKLYQEKVLFIGDKVDLKKCLLEL